MLLEATADSPGLVRLTFGLPTADEILGFGQPSTAVKVRAPGAWVRSRPYSISSGPALQGSFQLLIKLYPGGRVSGHLGSLAVGQSGWFAKTRSKPLAEGVRKAGLIAYGVGISDCIHTSRTLLESGTEQVTLLHCVRFLAEAVLRDEMDALQKDYPDRFTVKYFLSRESPENIADVPGAVCGRLDQLALEAAFGEWKTIGRDCAFLAVGTKAMARQTYGMLSELGLPRHLCGFKGTERPAEEVSGSDSEDKLL